MTDKADNTTAKASRNRHKGWLYAALGLLTAVFLLLILPGTLLRFAIKYGLEDIGFIEVNVERSDASLIDLLFGVGGIQAQAPDGSGVELGQLSTDISWPDLFNRHLRLQEMNLTGLRLEVARDDEGRLQISGLPLPVRDSDQIKQDEETGEGGWTIGADRVVFTDSRVTYRQGRAILPIEVRRLQIEGIDGQRPRQHGRIEFTGRLAGAPLHIKGTARPTGDPLTADLTIRLQGLPLAGLADFSEGVLDRLAGSLDLDIALNTSVPGDGAVMAKITGPIALRDFAGDIGALKLSWVEMDWRGERDFDGTTLRLLGELGLKELAVEREGLQIGLASVGWTGPVTLNMSPDGAPQRFEFDGDFDHGAIELSQEGLQLKSFGATWKGRAGLSLSPNLSPEVVELEGTLRQNDFELTQRGLALKTAGFFLARTGKTNLRSGRTAAANRSGRRISTRRNRFRPG